MYQSIAASENNQHLIQDLLVVLSAVVVDS